MEGLCVLLSDVVPYLPHAQQFQEGTREGHVDQSFVLQTFGKKSTKKEEESLHSGHFGVVLGQGGGE